MSNLLRIFELDCNYELPHDNLAKQNNILKFHGNTYLNNCPFIIDINECSFGKMKHARAKLN